MQNLALRKLSWLSSEVKVAIITLRVMLMFNICCHVIFLNNSIRFECFMNLITFNDFLALISEIIRRHHYCESVSVVGGEFKPIDFKADWVKIDENAKMDVFDNESVGELGVQRFVQRTDGNQMRSLNRPLERIRKGYRLSSKCWD